MFSRFDTIPDHDGRPCSRTDAIAIPILCSAWLRLQTRDKNIKTGYGGNKHCIYMKDDWFAL